MSDIIKSINPATLEEIKSISITPTETISELVEKSRSAQHKWARQPIEKRAKYLLKARQYLLDNINDFAKTISTDNGKPMTEAITAEIFPIADLIFHFAKYSKRYLKDEKIDLGIWKFLGRRSRVLFRPYGVIGIISPWNYPFSIPTGAVITALISGNSVLLKPSSATALVGEKIEEMFKAADLPENLFIHLPGTSKTGSKLLESNVDKVFFTGSTGVGKIVMEKCAETLTPCNLELGGKDPMIVCSDVDLEAAASAAVWGAFTNSGQCCASVERLYVDEKIYDDFVDLAVKKTENLKVGIGTDPNTEIGPLTTESQLKTLEKHVDDAKRRGGKILTGGQRHPDLKGYFYLPTIITGVDNDFLCVSEETFGPIMPVMKFSDIAEAVDLANKNLYGLNAYVWTKSNTLGEKIANNLNAGTVAINECVYTHALPQTPWGGIKKSGFGRTHGKIGLKEMVVPYHIHSNRFGSTKDIWWYPYNKNLYELFVKLTKRMTGKELTKFITAPLFIVNIFKKNKGS